MGIGVPGPAASPYSGMTPGAQSAPTPTTGAITGNQQNPASGAAQFGAAQKPQKGGVKFGFEPITCCILPCAAPLIVGCGGILTFILSRLKGKKGPKAQKA